MAEIDSTNSKNCLILTDSEERRIKNAKLLIEKQKLEEMIIDLFRKGKYNMGTDKKILKQSGVIDKLIVDEMTLDIMNEKYHGGTKTQ